MLGSASGVAFWLLSGVMVTMLLVNTPQEIKVINNAKASVLTGSLVTTKEMRADSDTASSSSSPVAASQA
jgi:hypothetical protein